MNQYKERLNSYDLTVMELCEKLDMAIETADYWKSKHDELRAEYAKFVNDQLAEAKKGVAQALVFALSVEDAENGDLVIPKEVRQKFTENCGNV